MRWHTEAHGGSPTPEATAAGRGGGVRGAAHLVQDLHSSVGWAPRCSLRRWSILGWPGALQEGGSGGDRGPAHVCTNTHTCQHAGTADARTHMLHDEARVPHACGRAPGSELVAVHLPPTPGRCRALQRHRAWQREPLRAGPGWLVTLV